MTYSPPDGTRFVPPDAAQARARALAALRELYSSWGYQPVEVPALERYVPEHPRAAQSFKLSDRDSGVLALRTDFTPALAQLVRTSYPAVADGERRALRFCYAGTVWHAIHPELARTREFTQVGLELIGISHARADAEIIHLARESVRAVGLVPRVEVGNPAFVRAAFDAAEVPASHRDALADAIDRKDRSDIASVLDDLEVRGRAAEALMSAPDLYGGVEVLDEARRVAPSDDARAAIDRLEGVVAEFEDDSELQLDLGMARRLSYYTGVTFRAYTLDFGQPLLGGGRYDGALLPYAAGFSLGLERLLSALPAPGPATAPEVLAIDDPGARTLRAAGVVVARAIAVEVEAATQEARALGVPFLLVDGEIRSVGGRKRVPEGHGDVDREVEEDRDVLAARRSALVALLGGDRGE